MAKTKPPYPSLATEAPYGHFTKAHKLLKNSLSMFNGSINIIIDAIERGETAKAYAQQLIADRILSDLQAYKDTTEACLDNLIEAAKTESDLFSEDGEPSEEAVDQVVGRPKALKVIGGGKKRKQG